MVRQFDRDLHCCIAGQMGRKALRHSQFPVPPVNSSWGVEARLLHSVGAAGGSADTTRNQEWNEGHGREIYR
jgi:hypothetical protein